MRVNVNDLCEIAQLKDALVEAVTAVDCPFDKTSAVVSPLRNTVDSGLSVSLIVKSSGHACAQQLYMQFVLTPSLAPQHWTAKLSCNELQWNHPGLTANEAAALAAREIRKFLFENS